MFNRLMFSQVFILSKIIFSVIQNFIIDGVRHQTMTHFAQFVILLNSTINQFN